MVSTGDDYYGDDDGFDNYIPNSVDPGPWMLIGVCLYSVFCIVILPIIVFLGRRRKEGRLEHHMYQEEDECLEMSIDSSRQDEGISKAAQLQSIEVELYRHEEDLGERKDQSDGKYKNKAKDHPVLGSEVSFASGSSYASTLGHRSKGNRHRRKTKKAAMRMDLYTRSIESESYVPVQKYKIGVGPGKKEFVKKDVEEGNSVGGASKDFIDDILPEHAADADDPGVDETFLAEEEENIEAKLCCGPRALFSRRSLKISLNGLVRIANPDRETQRLLKLGIPLTLAAVFESLFDAICVALISQYLGVQALTAYVVAETMLGLSDIFIGGVSDTLNTLCSHAIGAANYDLAGQYVQIATLSYLIASVPLFGIWWFFMGDVIRLFGMNERVVQMGVDYTKVAIFDYILEGISDSYSVLLDISGYAVPATIYDIVAGASDCIILWLLLAFYDGANLFWVAVAMLASNIFFFVLFAVIAICLGWLDPFWNGMIKSCAFKNADAVKNVLHTAIPLAIGSLLEYGEWEALTIFAAVLGPAEVAAWGILESIWDLFESATEGLSDSGAIRLAYHLGKGNVEEAQLSAWKSLFMSSVLAVFITCILFICGDTLPKWFTSDVTLQNMLTPMIPLIGIGNILMIFGMVSWSLVGAQGRFKLATSVSAIMTFCVTVPLAAIFCIVKRYDLQALVASVVIGYSTTGLILAYVLLTSDWEHISRTIRDYNEAEDISLSDDSDDESSSSSSSSSEGLSLEKDVHGIDDESGVSLEKEKAPQSPQRIIVLPTDTT